MFQTSTPELTLLWSLTVRCWLCGSALWMIWRYWAGWRWFLLCRSLPWHLHLFHVVGWWCYQGGWNTSSRVLALMAIRLILLELRLKIFKLSLWLVGTIFVQTQKLLVWHLPYLHCSISILRQSRQVLQQNRILHELIQFLRTKEIFHTNYFLCTFCFSGNKNVMYNELIHKLVSVGGRSKLDKCD